MKIYLDTGATQANRLVQLEDQNVVGVATKLGYVYCTPCAVRLDIDIQEMPMGPHMPSDFIPFNSEPHCFDICEACGSPCQS